MKSGKQNAILWHLASPGSCMDLQDFQRIFGKKEPKVLVVDDDAMTAEIEAEILGKENFKVVICSDGYSALLKLQEEDFDVVLLDRQMPGMDGVEVCGKIRNELGNLLIPIIMVTGQTERQSLVDSLDSGATDFVKKPFDPVELVARVRAAAHQKNLTDQLDSAESMLFTLARMVEAKDECTGNHCSRLSRISVRFGESLELDEASLIALEQGGVLHDIGKLGIPDYILNKPGKLSDDEMAIMRTHAMIGFRLCEGLNGLRLTLPIIRHHHERWDGTGYPDGLAGDDIPVVARVFQLADIYDALRNERPYKRAFSLDKTINIIEEEAANGLLDPHLTVKFIKLVRQSSVDVSSVDDNIDLGESRYLGIRDIVPITPPALG